MAIKLENYWFATIADHDDSLRLEPDYAQKVIADSFEISSMYRADEIDLCFKAYTLNAIKMAPTYMLKRIFYDESLLHREDIKYWRDVFQAFTPIAVKSPGWSDIYYRTVRPRSASRGYVESAIEGPFCTLINSQ